MNDVHYLLALASALPDPGLDIILEIVIFSPLLDLVPAPPLDSSSPALGMVILSRLEAWEDEAPWTRMPDTSSGPTLDQEGLGRGGAYGPMDLLDGEDSFSQSWHIHDTYGLQYI